ncbi:MAG: hypothetical protein IKA21_00810, partial [Phascolarctobacterium sp.]|nr:hypothetical protein [Phascolarctobacterium sp.]
EVNGVDVPYVISPRRDGDIAACYADASKAKEELGWNAEKTVVDMCRDSWNFVKANKKYNKKLLKASFLYEGSFYF